MYICINYGGVSLSFEMNKISIMTLNLKNIIWKEGKYYVAQCLNVDISSFGKTKNEALKNLNEALELYFEDSKIIKLPKVERPEIFSSKVKYA